MGNTEPLRIGFIGAGGICRARHLPGLAKIPGVQVVAVANRTPESGRRIAQDFHIAEVFDDWRRLLERPDIDAVFIGTWPYMHCAMALAALEAGKHVFCQARMAMNLDEAKRMVEAAKARPQQVTMLCPPPHRMPFEPFIRQVVSQGRLGTITAIELTSVSGANLNPDQITWRERVEYSGRQTLAVGIYAEVLNAWFGPYQRLAAQTATPLAVKRGPDGQPTPIGVPQVVTVTGTLAGGVLCVEHHTGLAADISSRRDCLTVWGVKGTLRHKFLTDTIEMAGVGEAFKPIDMPAALRREWWAEEEFIQAVRQARAGKSWSVTPGFPEGLLYMRKVEAIHLSAATGQGIEPAAL